MAQQCYTVISMITFSFGISLIIICPGLSILFAAYKQEQLPFTFIPNQIYSVGNYGENYQYLIRSNSSLKKKGIGANQVSDSNEYLRLFLCFPLSHFYRNPKKTQRK